MGQLPADRVSTLDAAARASFQLAAAPGAIVGVRTPDGTWTAAYGLADPTTGVPMTVDMHSRIGSVTKTFTGTLILQLAQDGRLKLTDTIDRYYHGVPNGDRITLNQLATNDQRRRELLHRRLPQPLLRPSRDGLHARPAHLVRAVRLARLRARRALRLLEHQHDPARGGGGEGDRATGRGRPAGPDPRGRSE
jgi:hypothetical protein